MLTYIDCGSGIAGDMLLGALIGLGLSPRELERTLQSVLKEKGWSLRVTQTERQQWPAWSVKVHGDRPYGSLEKMQATVRRAALPAWVKSSTLQIFDRLEFAERQAHGHSKGGFDPEELGLLDTLVDVVGNSWGFWKLNLRDVISSPINTGRIAPATATMVQKARTPVYSTSTALELATPTGVAILLQFAKEFKPMPQMQLENTGYGAGAKDTPDRPNVVGVYQGTLVKPANSVRPVLPVQFSQPAQPTKPAKPTEPPLEAVVLLSTVIDDMDPRLYPHVTDLLFKGGALDVWWAPIGMKKGRPGIAFTVLCRPEEESALLKILFRETTTLGVRRLPVQRWVLPRTAKGLRKIAHLPGGRTKTQTEFEVAKKVSAARAIPLLKLLK